VERGLALFNQGKYAEALEVLTQVIKEDPTNVRAWNARGMTKRRLKDLDGAWDDLTRAIELSPRYASAHNNRGLVRADRGDYEGAIADYSRAIEFNATLSTSFNNRGVAKSKLGDYAGAIADYARAIELAPTDPVPYANRAADRNRKGDVAGAREDVQKALSLDPTYAFALEVQQRLNPPPVEFDLDARDPIAASATTEVTVGDITVRVPLDSTAPVVVINKAATPYGDLKELEQVLARREAALTRENAGARPRRDVVMLGGIPATRWTWTTTDNRTIFDYAVRNATTVYTVRAEAAGVVTTEPQAVRDVLDSLTIGGLPVEPELEADAGATDVGAEDATGAEPPSWTLDKAASQRMADPCGPGGIPATDTPLPLPPATETADLRGLETTLAHSINRLNRTQYAGAVVAAMQATRILMGPLTPTQEQQVFAAWAPLLDYPTDRVLAYLEQLNPLLVEFIALMRGVEAAEAGLEQAQYEAEMAATYDHEAGTRAAMATAMRYVAELKRYKARINDVAARVAALGDPPDPMIEKCEARTRAARAIEFLKTLPAPKATAPEETPSGDDPPWEFLKTAPPSERPYFKGKGYPYWLALAARGTAAGNQVRVSAKLDFVRATVDAAGAGFSASAGYQDRPDVAWTGRTFSFTVTEPLFTTWTCPEPPQAQRDQIRGADQHVVRGTISDDGMSVLTLTVDSVRVWCSVECTHGPERINKVTGEHNHRLTGEDTKDVSHRGEARREFVNLPLTRPQAALSGNVYGARLEYRVHGIAVRKHVRSLTPYTLLDVVSEGDDLVVDIYLTEYMSGTAPTPAAVSARDQQIAIHTENIRLITEDLARLRDQLNQARDADNRTFYQYMITSKSADLQRERDAIATVQSGNFTRTMTAWDAIGAGADGGAVARDGRADGGPSLHRGADRAAHRLPAGRRPCRHAALGAGADVR